MHYVRNLRPAPSNEVHAACRAITYKDLPVGAKALLRQLKSDTGPSCNYDYGAAVDLNGDGISGISILLQ